MTYFKTYNRAHRKMQIYKCDGENYWYTHPGKGNKWCIGSTHRTVSEMMDAFRDAGIEYKLATREEVFRFCL